MEALRSVDLFISNLNVQVCLKILRCSSLNLKDGVMTPSKDTQLCIFFIQLVYFLLFGREWRNSYLASSWEFPQIRRWWCNHYFFWWFLFFSCRGQLSLIINSDRSKTLTLYIVIYLHNTYCFFSCCFFFFSTALWCHVSRRCLSAPEASCSLRRSSVSCPGKQGAIQIPEVNNYIIYNNACCVQYWKCYIVPASD